MGSKIGFQVISFFVYVLAQVLIVQNMVLFDSAFCFVYVAFLLCLPVDMSKLMLLFIGFVTGISIDIFYDTLGMHAAACVFIMFIRDYWLNSITPQGGYDVGTIPTINFGGWQWLIGYMTPLVFIHHIFLLYIEASGFGLFWFTLYKVLLSTVFSMVVIILVQFLFYKGKRI